MPRFTQYDDRKTVMLPVDFEQQILPGTFEYSLHDLVDNELDLCIFNSRFKNDETGRPVYDPAILLKVALLAYSRGITSSGKIEALCRENVILMALSADSRPHITTIERMKQKIESVLGRHIYGRRLGIVEPVFGNL